MDRHNLFDRMAWTLCLILFSFVEFIVKNTTAGVCTLRQLLDTYQRKYFSAIADSIDSHLQKRKYQKNLPTS